MSTSRPGQPIQLKMVASIALLLCLLIGAVTGLASWLIALCGSFVARNPEHAMVHGATAAFSICLGDKLQIRCRASL